MATHYANEHGIPACGYAVVTEEVTRQSRWKKEPTVKVVKRVTEQVDTSMDGVGVDCEDCIPFMEADGIA